MNTSTNPNIEVDISRNYGRYFINSSYFVTEDGKVEKLLEQRIDIPSGAMARSNKADPYLQFATQLATEEGELRKSKFFYKKE